MLSTELQTQICNQHRLPLGLGSNSFRLEIDVLTTLPHPPHRIHQETVRQGSGLDEDRNLSLPAMQRGWDCLARFGERLAGFDKTQVRAVATQTLREAVNREEFIRRGQKTLGFPHRRDCGP